MTIPKATEILKLAISDPDLVSPIDLLEAQKVAIDLLTFFEECYTEGFLFKTRTLIGEDSR